MVRINRGRQKIEMKKMVNESNLQVTFSKRRFGLFKKASELCTLCGAEVLMIVFSPSGKAFSFGHPSVNDMINRLSNYNRDPRFVHHHNLQLANTRPSERIENLNAEITQVMAIQEREKIKRKFLDSLSESEENNRTWYKNDVGKLDPNQTNSLIYALGNIIDKLASEISHYPQLNYLGENSGYMTQGLGDGSHETGFDVFDQRRMFDINAFTDNQNYISSVGSCTDGQIVPRNNMNYV